MKNFPLTRDLDWRELTRFAPVYFALSAINLSLKIHLTKPWLDGTLAANHRALLAFDYTNNEQSRWLQFYVPELFHRLLRLEVESAYALQRLAFVFVAYASFHVFLRRWFEVRVAFAGVLFLAAITPFTFLIADLQESSPLLLVTFLLGLWAMRDGSLPVMLAALFVGALNNETVLILPLAYFFLHYERGAFWKISLRAFGIALPVLLTQGPIRYLTRDRPHLGKGLQLRDNVLGILKDFAVAHNPLEWHRTHYLHFLILFGVLWAYAYVGSKPLFLRRVMLIVPFFVLPHLVTGSIFEPRQMLPLAFVMIPSSLFYFRGPDADRGQ